MLARVRTPKDKASIEGSVGVISTWIIAVLRNAHCFSIEELKEKVRKKIDEFNKRPFIRKKGARLSAFEEEEKFALFPLHISPYKMAKWKREHWIQTNNYMSIACFIRSLTNTSVEKSM